MRSAISTKTIKRSPTDEDGQALRPGREDSELKRRAIERWENEGGRPLPTDSSVEIERRDRN